MKKAFVLVLGLMLLAPSPAFGVDGVGGGAGFDSQSEFPFVAGITSQIPLSFFVQNLGDSEVEVSLGGETPAGITYIPQQENVVLSPGAVTNYQFSIQVAEETPPGDYELIPVIKPQIEVDTEEGSTFLPGIAGSLKAKVIGASADVRITARNFFTGTPVQGTLTLLYADTPTLPVKIAETDEPVLESRVVPGNYVARFDVPGLQTVEEQFSIAEGEQKDIVIQVKGLQFTLTSAEPRLDRNGDLISAELVAVVRNDLTRVQDSTSLEVDISRDGSSVETLLLAQYPELPEGIAQQRLSYVPDGGFSGGLWEFQFKLRSEDFVLEAPDVESFRVPSFLENNLWTILTILAFLTLILLALPKKFWSWSLARFNKRNEKEEERQSVV